MDIPAGAKCPVHPHGNHTWESCTLNPKNKNKEEKKTPMAFFNKKVKNKPVPTADQYMAEAGSGPDDSSVESSGTESSGKKKSKNQQTKFASTHDSYCTNILVSSNDFQTETCLDNAISNAFMAITEDAFTNGGYDDIEIKDITNPISNLRLKPIGVAVVNTIQGHTSSKPLKVLFDTGSDKTFVNRRILPKGANGKTVSNSMFSTINGVKTINQQVELEGIILPEFSPTKKIDKPMSALVFEDEGLYDIIFGLDFLVPVGIEISCLTQTISWDNVKVPWQPKTTLKDNKFGSYLIQTIDSFNEDPDQDWDCFAAQTSVKEILESKYDKVSTNSVAQEQVHLTPRQREVLAVLLGDYSKLFSGKLGAYPNYKVHLDLLPNAKPFYTRYYSVPKLHEKVFKQELECLVELRVLS